MKLALAIVALYLLYLVWRGLRRLWRRVFTKTQWPPFGTTCPDGWQLHSRTENAGALMHNCVAPAESSTTCELEGRVWQRRGESYHHAFDGSILSAEAYELARRKGFYVADGERKQFIDGQYKSFPDWAGDEVRRAEVCQWVRKCEVPWEHIDENC